MPRHVIVCAPSRLHFGLFALAAAEGRQFGGVGAMVRRPGLQLRAEAADSWSVSGPLSPRIAAAAEQWRKFHRLAALPRCRIAVDHAPPEHVGLGVGTQLALSVAAGLAAMCGIPAGSPPELALSVGRGKRSAIGTYGFALGGLIVDQGKLQGESISPLDTRLEFPSAWRFLLVRPQDARGLSGEIESAAMDQIAVAPQTTESLRDMIREQLVPAVATGDYAAFAASLFRYSAAAGSFYAEHQGGPYNGPVLTALVEQIRSLGGEGVGQSSWGPTLFIVQPDQTSAEQLAQRLRAAWRGPPLDLIVAEPDNEGAVVQRAD